MNICRRSNFALLLFGFGARGRPLSVPLGGVESTLLVEEAMRNLHLSSFTVLEGTRRELAQHHQWHHQRSQKGTRLVEGLSEALPVEPAKLVRRILRADDVDMAELLKVNMKTERRRVRPYGQGRVTRREVLSWM